MAARDGMPDHTAMLFGAFSADRGAALWAGAYGT